MNSDYGIEQMSTDDLLELRKQKKQEAAVLDARQQALKIQLNSCYGCSSNAHFRWFSRTNAEAITASGRMAIRWMEAYINNYFNRVLNTTDRDYVAAIDTDSLIINMTAFVDTFWADKSESELVDILDKVCEEKIEHIIQQGYDRLADVTRAYDNKMKMEREVIGQGVFLQKKRYVIRMFDNEGVRFAEPELKITGHEANRSDIPHWGRNRMKDLLSAMFVVSESEIHDMISQYWNGFLQAPFDDIASTTSVQNLAKYRTAGGYAKGTPKHVKGALMFNKLLNDKQIAHMHRPIQDGEKVKLLPLHEPNPIGTNAIAYTDHLPEEFGLHRYIDKKSQFQSILEEPVDRVLSTFGWSTQKRVNILEELFG